MSIRPALRQLVTMLEGVDVHFEESEIDYTSTNFDPRVVCQVFKQFCQLNFDCSSFDGEASVLEEEGYRCLDWKDGCIVFGCGGSGKSFHLGFRRAFEITFIAKKVDSDDPAVLEKESYYYSELINCDMTFDSNDELEHIQTDDFLFPPYTGNELDDLNTFFHEVAPYLLLAAKCKPRELALSHSD